MSEKINQQVRARLKDKRFFNFYNEIKFVMEFDNQFKMFVWHSGIWWVVDVFSTVLRESYTKFVNPAERIKHGDVELVLYPMDSKQTKKIEITTSDIDTYIDYWIVVQK